MLKQAALLILMIATLGYSVLGGPVGPAWIPDLAARADAVVVASVRAECSHGIVNASIDVESVLFGSVTPGSLISMQWTVSGWPAPDGRLPDDHGLLFLRRLRSGMWVLLPVTGGDIQWRDVFIPTPVEISAGSRTVAAASLPRNPSTLDRVLVELVAATEAGARIPVDFVVIFRAHRSPVLEAAFRRFVTTADPRLRIIGLRGLISVGDPAAVQRLRDEHIVLESSPFWASALQELNAYFVSTDPTAITGLGSMAVDPKAPQDLRTAAASALARIHTPGTLPYLALLLTDPSSALQAAAVGGLAGFANNVPIGSHEPAAGPWKYRTDDTIAHSAFDESLVRQRQAYYVGFWQDWWRQHHADLGE